MLKLFDKVAARCSKNITRTYSTSFSLGIYFLERKLHESIYGIYGFVRFADEIVDTFHQHDKERLLDTFRNDTYKAIEDGISLNPVLHSFQQVVNRYHIERELIDTFLRSMEMDLEKNRHNQLSYEDYILGSAEVVGLMCLRVFCNGNEALYQSLKKPAMRLGSVFQKVNFLRDLHTDFHELKRTYFPNVDVRNFCEKTKAAIEADIREDFRIALDGIKRLPRGARFGVYVAYVYYRALLERIESTTGEALLRQRLSVPNHQKFRLLIHSYFRYSFGLL